MKQDIDYTLYLCTDRDLMSSKTIEESVEASIKGGCTLVQLREKDCSSKDFYELAIRVKKITDYYNVPLIINDRVDIAMAVDADGVHIGQSDLPAAVVRKIMGNDKIIGVSAANIAEAKKAAADGADYLGIGAMFTTNTKKDARDVEIQELIDIKKEVQIPVVAIGGINLKTVGKLKGTGIDGIAVISAIVSQDNVEEAARQMYQAFKE